MAFSYLKFQRWSSGFDLRNNAQWNYTDTAVTAASIAAADFFLPQWANITVGDLIWVVASDTNQFLEVLTSSSAGVTTQPFNTVLGAGSVGTTNLAALAVTNAKIAANAVDTAKLDVTTIQYLKVPMTAANFNGMYAAPFEILPAPGANKLHVVKQAMLEVDFGGAAFAAGGVFGLQYDATANGLGIGASATASAATAQWAVDSTLALAGACPTSAASATVNKSVCMSNLTAAFTTGTSTVDVHIWYETVTTTL